METNNFLNASFNEIVFHNRNKKYGAYVLRQEHERNTTIALISSYTLLAALLLIPALRNLISKTPPSLPLHDEILTIQEIVLPQTPKEEIKVTAPTAPAANTERYVEMTVTRQEQIVEQPVATIEQISQANIGTTTTENTNTNDIGSPVGTEGGTGITAPATPREEANKIWDITEVAPEFPGGTQALYKFIVKHTDYPARAKDIGEEAKVIVKFVVNEDGSISNTEVLRRVGFGFDEEAIRVINMLPKFKPAEQNGQKVKVRFVLPIYFKLH